MPVKLDSLREVAAAGVAVVVAVTGQRGVGKTQLAAAYARERAGQGWLVGWIAAENAATMASDLLDLADALGLRGADDEPSDRVLGRLRAHLNAYTGSGLLVFDNVTDPDDVVEHLPVAGSLQVIVTSTSTDTHNIGTPVAVDVFSPTTAIAFLSDLTQLDDEPGAAAVAEELGYLPLSLALAGARIRDHERSYADYLRHLDETTLDHLVPAKGHGYPAALTKTILLSVGRVEADHPHARLLLEAIALLAPDGVHRTLLETLLPTRDDFLTTAAALRRASLIDYAGEDGNTYLMHRLSQRVLREASSSLDETATKVTAALETHLPARNRSWELRAIGADLARHLAALTRHSAAALGLANQTTHFLHATANPATIPHAATTHRHHKIHLGGDHPKTLISADNLAISLDAFGRLDEAIPLHEQTLADHRRTLGNDHPSTLTSANNLATAYDNAGRLDDAIPLYEQTLADSRRILGNDHPDTLNSANNLAYAYNTAGRLDEAITLHQQTLADRRRTLGNDHPNTLTSANNLATAYNNAGRLDEAIPLYEQTLNDRRRTLGNDHPNTLNSANNLAGAYDNAGRLDDAIPLYEQTLNDRRQILGNDHPDTLNSANNLAYAYNAAGRLDDAIPLYKQAAVDCERVLGPNHPTTVAVTRNYAIALEEASKRG
ncbi:FxSxx-COOH system tetratricopeptide repeat protein [Actinokineospora cianjurensis]|uniref:FxSxx-COOH system tetratricopeptide repeat protein n=1 Tax=Actinokineospora cianjurensis TaxID=585224 RepID=UPI001FE6F724|nr:FxSxx-COOH system tetratricopeptide repeat protein [Actinokineospora cianjurensis]